MRGKYVGASDGARKGAKIERMCARKNDCEERGGENTPW